MHFFAATAEQSAPSRLGSSARCTSLVIGYDTHDSYLGPAALLLATSLVLVVPNDFKMGKGKIAAQCRYLQRINVHTSTEMAWVDKISKKDIHEPHNLFSSAFCLRQNYLVP
ncbi:hypothetical protein ACH5RR_017369 [Cinchona calisaya]|uniref:Uncharacterized protein n=1 Tax=Cinchona calisaya TaxID=153742 RepID=A0ABD3A1X3_9GENT